MFKFSSVGLLSHKALLRSYVGKNLSIIKTASLSLEVKQAYSGTLSRRNFGRLKAVLILSDFRRLKAILGAFECAQVAKPQPSRIHFLDCGPYHQNKVSCPDLIIYTQLTK